MFLIALLPALFAAAGCAPGMSKDELLKEMQEGRAPLIVDVRSRAEFDRDHVPGAIHIPFTSIRSGLPKSTGAKGDRLVVYCEHGPRAVIAGIVLYLSGYDNIYALDGQMKAWRQAEFPIEIGAH